MTGVVPSRKAVLREFESRPQSIKEHFKHLKNLLDDNELPLTVALAYVFLYLEVELNIILRFGVTKLHCAQSQKADEVINKQHMTREGFLEFYKNIYGEKLDKPTMDIIKYAEGIRDKVMHGKGASDGEIRKAIVDVLNYAQALNSNVKGKTGFEPLGDLRGNKGAKKPLDAKTTHWILKGMGFGQKDIQS